MSHAKRSVGSIDVLDKYANIHALFFFNLAVVHLCHGEGHFVLLFVAPFKPLYIRT
jgi:hypothetical protein